MEGHTIEVEQLSQRVRVEIDGTTVADTRRPVLLSETHLPPRYYLPREDVRAELLQPSETRTTCPFKGEAGYFSVVIDGRVHEDVVWYYEEPLDEVAAIRGTVCFYNDKVDLYVDEQLVTGAAA